jgi:hypothetical protein
MIDVFKNKIRKTKVITPRQAYIYLVWAKNNNLDPVPVTSRHRNYRFRVASTTAELGIGKERVRQVLAKVLELLSKGTQIEEATQIILREYEKFN